MTLENVLYSARTAAPTWPPTLGVPALSSIRFPVVEAVVLVLRRRD